LNNKPSLVFVISASALALAIATVPFIFLEPESAGVTVQELADGSNALEAEFESMAAPI